MSHPRLDELPPSYQHERHFWIFNLPERETQNWLSRFWLDHRMTERRRLHGPIITRRAGS